METGTQIGPYRIEALLGRGGMAEVYKAWHDGLHRHEALKTPLPHFAHDQDFVRRFLDEARKAAQFSHPNITMVHAVSAADAPQPYFTMELIEGGDLADLLEQRGRLPLAEAMALLQQIATALDYAHSRGVVHRDVKPGNVLLKPYLKPDGHGGWTVKVADFGIARAVEQSDGTRLTQIGLIAGAPAYMSPEQGGGGPQVGYSGPVDHRTDVYALGVVAYEMLCGQPPFLAMSDTSPLGIIMRHVSEPPRPPREHVPGLAIAVNNAILKALAKHPGQRFNSCGEFIEALSAQNNAPSPAPPLTAPPLTASPPGAPPPMAPPPARSRVAPMLIGAAVLGGLGLIGWGLFNNPTPPAPSPQPSPGPSITATPFSGTPMPPGTVAVPDLIGMKESQARDMAGAKSLTLDVATGYSESVPPNVVMSQYPGTGATVAQGALVRVRVSLGPNWAEKKRLADQLERQRLEQQRRREQAQAEAARRQAQAASDITGVWRGTWGPPKGTLRIADRYGDTFYGTLSTPAGKVRVRGTLSGHSVTLQETSIISERHPGDWGTLGTSSGSFSLDWKALHGSGVTPNGTAYDWHLYK